MCWNTGWVGGCEERSKPPGQGRGVGGGVSLLRQTGLMHSSPSYGSGFGYSIQCKCSVYMLWAGGQFFSDN